MTEEQGAELIARAVALYSLHEADSLAWAHWREWSVGVFGIVFMALCALLFFSILNTLRERG